MPEFDPRNHSVVVYNQAGAVVMKLFVTDARVRIAVTAERLPPHAPPGTTPEVVVGREAEVLKALVETIAGIVAPASRKHIADEANYTSSDFPTRGCRQCGKTDRPQYKGVCNDANCDRE